MKPLAAILLGATMSLPANAQSADAQALYQLGRDSAGRGESEKAVEFLEKAVAMSPTTAGYHYQLANAYGLGLAGAGMFKAMSVAKKMKAELERAIQLDPNLTPARMSLLEFYVAAPAIAGGSESAALAQVVEIRKRDAVDGHRAFARIHTAAKKPELARKEFADMVKEQPASARVHYFFGVYLMLTEKSYKSASEEFETAVRLDSAYLPAYFQIGHVAALAANDFARGEETLKQYLGYQPKDEEPLIARAHYWLGVLYEKQGKKAEAKASYAASLKLNPNQKDVDAAMKRVS